MIARSNLNLLKGCEKQRYHSIADDFAATEFDLSYFLELSQEMAGCVMSIRPRKRQVH